MKKIKFLLGILTIAASTSLLSSCFTDPTFGTPPSVNQVEDKTYTITVNTNVPPKEVTITYDGQPVNSTFNPTKSGNLVVSATGYVTQTVPVTLGDSKDIIFDFTLIKTPTSDLTVDAANTSGKDETVSNSDENKSDVGGEATITIPAATTTTGVSDGTSAFGIGVYSVPGNSEGTPKKDDDASGSVLVANCQPTGATFDPQHPVTITVPTPNSDGLAFDCVYEGDNNEKNAKSIKVNANTVSAEVTHFSTWNFILKATVVDVQSDVITLFDGNILINTGNNKVSYNAHNGFGSTRGGIVENFLAGKFGAKDSRPSKVSNVSSTGTGSAHIRIIQHVQKITYRSGNNTTFTATIYGAIELQVVSVTYDTSGHSGGTGGN